MFDRQKISHGLNNDRVRILNFHKVNCTYKFKVPNEYLCYEEFHLFNFYQCAAWKIQTIYIYIMSYCSLITMNLFLSAARTRTHPLLVYFVCLSKKILFLLKSFSIFCCVVVLFCSIDISNFLSCYSVCSRIWAYTIKREWIQQNCLNWQVMISWTISRNFCVFILKSSEYE